MFLFGLVEYLTGKMPLDVAAISVGVMVPLVAVTGVILYVLGLRLLKRCRNLNANSNSTPSP